VGLDGVEDLEETMMAVCISCPPEREEEEEEDAEKGKLAEIIGTYS
jgi:hypothetical protein